MSLEPHDPTFRIKSRHIKGVYISASDDGPVVEESSYIPEPMSDELKELYNYFGKRENYNARDFAPIWKSYLDREADRVEKIYAQVAEDEYFDVLTSEYNHTKYRTNKELNAVKAAFTDEDYQNFLAMREKPGKDPDGQDTLPTEEEYERATGRKLNYRYEPEPGEELNAVNDDITDEEIKHYLAMSEMHKNGGKNPNGQDT